MGLRQTVGEVADEEMLCKIPNRGSGSVSAGKLAFDEQADAKIRN